MKIEGPSSTLVRATVVVALLALLPTPSVGAAQRPALSVEIMPVEDLRPGMTGRAYTVLHGTEPQEFEVEILGVLEDPMPKQDLIVARLSGAGVGEIGVAAGMSGSPVYIDGKLVGAIAYRLGGFPKEAIAGITPIELMLEIPEETASGGAPPGASMRMLAEARDLMRGEPVSPSITSSSGGSGGIRPIATPISISGIDPEVVETLAPLFASMGWHPTVGGTSSRAEANGPPVIGGTVAVHLMRGDITFTASGTVTHVEGDRVWAFGHPFMQGGAVAFPMSGGEVLLMRGDLSYPEKIVAAGTEAIGTIRQDRQTGIWGTVGAPPPMIPVSIDVNGPDGAIETYDFEMITDKTLSPTFLFIGLTNGLTTTGKQYGESTFEVEARFELEGADGGADDGEVVEIRNVYSAPSIAYLSLSQAIMNIYGLLYDNAFEPVAMRSIEFDINGGDDRRLAEISRIWADRVDVRPGEEVGVSVWLKPYRSPEVVERVRFEIPESAPAGPLTVHVGGAAEASRQEQSIGRGSREPTSLSDLVHEIERMRVNDRIYLQLTSADEGALFDGELMPSLPVSMLQVLSSARTSGEVVRLSRTLLVEESRQVGYVVSGEHRIDLNVRR